MTAKQNLRPFLGSDGQTYQRRGDIPLGLLFQYFRDFDGTMVNQFEWFMLFMGLTDKKPSDLTEEERQKLHDAAPWTTDQYAAIADTLIMDIRQPATPLVNGAEGGAVPHGKATTQTASPS